MKKLLLFIPIIIFISSCTITKRVHRPGFYISSHRNIKVTKAKEETKTYIVEEKVDTTATPVSNNKAEKEEVVGITESKSYQEEKIEFKQKKTPIITEKKRSSKNYVLKTISKTNLQEIEQKDKVDFGFWAFLLGLIAVSLLLLGLAFGFGGFIGATLLITALVLGVIAIKINQTSDSKPKNYWMPILVVIFGVIGLVFFALFFFLVFKAPVLGVLITLLAIAFLIFVFAPIEKTPFKKFILKHKTKPQAKKSNKEGESKITNKLSLYALALIIVPVLSIIFAALSIRQIKQNPSKYKNTWIPILAYIIGLITTLVFLLLLSYFAFYEGLVLFAVFFGLCILLIIASIVILYLK